MKCNKCGTELKFKEEWIGEIELSENENQLLEANKDYLDDWCGECGAYNACVNYHQLTDEEPFHAEDNDWYENGVYTEEESFELLYEAYGRTPSEALKNLYDQIPGFLERQHNLDIDMVSRMTARVKEFHSSLKPEISKRYEGLKKKWRIQ